MRFTFARPIWLAAAVLTILGSAPAETPGSTAHELVMPAFIEQFSADRLSLQRTYPLEMSAAHLERLSKFYSDELQSLDAIDFDHLAHSDQVDYLLLRNLLDSQIHHQQVFRKQIDEMAPLLPFEKNVESLLEAKRLMQRPSGERVLRSSPRSRAKSKQHGRNSIHLRATTRKAQPQGRKSIA